MFPPDFDGMTPEERARQMRWSPGMAAADEVDKAMRGELEPVTEHEATEAAPVVAQTVQAATGWPAFLIKPLIRRALRWLPRLAVGVLCILAAQYFVPALAINLSRLWRFVESGEWLDWAESIMGAH